MTFKTQKLAAFDEKFCDGKMLFDKELDCPFIYNHKLKSFLSTTLDEYEAHVREVVGEKKKQALEHPMLTQAGVEAVRYNEGYDSALSDLLSALNL